MARVGYAKHDVIEMSDTIHPKFEHEESMEIPFLSQKFELQMKHLF